MRDARALIGWLLVSALGTSWTACQPTREGAEEESSPVEAGSVLSLSGTLASYGELEKRGFDLAVARINDQGGIDGRPLELLYEDSELNAAKAVSSYNKLVSVDRVPIIVGAIGSSVCLALAPLATRDEVVVMSAGSTSPQLSGVSPYFFRVAPSDTLGAARLVDWVLEDGAERVAILVIENDYGIGQRNVAIQRLRETEVEPVLIETVLPEASDLRAQVQRIARSNPDAVLLLTHSPEAGYFLKQADEAGFEARFYGGDALSDPSIVSIAGAASEGVRFLLPAKGSGPAYEAFATAYRGAYGAEPDAVGLKAYSLTQVAAEALRNAEYSGPALRDYLAANTFQTAMGPVRFDANGDIAEVGFDQLEYRNGQAEVIGND